MQGGNVASTSTVWYAKAALHLARTYQDIIPADLPSALRYMEQAQAVARSLDPADSTVLELLQDSWETLVAACRTTEAIAAFEEAIQLYSAPAHCGINRHLDCCV